MVYKYRNISKVRNIRFQTEETYQNEVKKISEIIANGKKSGILIQ